MILTNNKMSLVENMMDGIIISVGSSKIWNATGNFLNIQFNWSRQASVSWEQHMLDEAVCLCMKERENELG